MYKVALINSLDLPRMTWIIPDGFASPRFSLFAQDCPGNYRYAKYWNILNWVNRWQRLCPTLRITYTMTKTVISQVWPITPCLTYVFVSDSYILSTKTQPMSWLLTVKHQTITPQSCCIYWLEIMTNGDNL